MCAPTSLAKTDSSIQKWVTNGLPSQDYASHFHNIKTCTNPQLHIMYICVSTSGSNPLLSHSPPVVCMNVP